MHSASRTVVDTTTSADVGENVLEMHVRAVIFLEQELHRM